MKPEKKTGKKPGAAKTKPAPQAPGKASTGRQVKAKSAVAVPAPVAKAAKVKVERPAKPIRGKPAPKSAAKPIAANAQAPAKQAAPLKKAPKPAKARKALAVPPILFEGDTPPPPPVSGPGARYALTPETIISQVASSGGELPQSYGTKNLFLAARDPHWLHASWDLTDEQQREYNARSGDGHLVLRVFANDETQLAIPEVHVHPESRSWFIHVPLAETRYRAELGLYERNQRWITIARSRSTLTPPDAPSQEVGADFATIPPEVPFQKIVEVVRDFMSEHQPLMQTVVQATAASEPPPTVEPRVPERPPEPGPKSASIVSPPPSEPPVTAVAPKLPPAERKATAAFKPARTYRAEIPVRIERQENWSDDRARALARLISVDAFRRVWMGSIEITELVRRHLQEETGSIAAADLARAGAPGPARLPDIGAPSSLFEGPIPERGRGFWFKVNAELILYGATEPDARVTIAGRLIKLRPDGSFSFRFSLPDGRYQLPAVAISRDGADGREARLEFSRSTDYHGQVEAHPQHENLRPPRAENFP